MKYKIDWMYKLPSKEKILFTSDWLEPEVAIEAGVELEKSKDAREIRFVDEMNTTWTLKEIRKLTKEIEAEPHNISLYFDGGFRTETNEAGIGVIIYYSQGKENYRIRANERVSEIDTNNEAEYAALYYALSLLEELGVHHLPCEIKGDSQGLLMQLAGEWPCYEERLNRWLDRIEEKISVLGIKPNYTVISRKENKDADKLASQALEGSAIYSKLQLP